MLKRDIVKLDKLELMLSDYYDLIVTAFETKENGSLNKDEFAKIDKEIRSHHREIIKLAQKLILRDQPVAIDLRRILRVIRKSDEFKQSYRIFTKVKDDPKKVLKVLLKSVDLN